MDVIVLDLETTGLDTTTCKVTEVCAMDLNDVDRVKYFVPHHDVFDPVKDGNALRLTKYFERGLHNEMLSNDQTILFYHDLHTWLQGNVIAGSNPRFDANILSRVFRNLGLDPEPWHHRLLDLSAYAAGALGIPVTEIPGLATVCKLLGVTFEPDHTAYGDVAATRACFHEIDNR